MPTRTPTLAAILAAAALASGLVPAAASAAPTADPGRSEYAAGQTLETAAPVVTGRTDGGSDGRKN